MECIRHRVLKRSVIGLLVSPWLRVNLENVGEKVRRYYKSKKVSKSCPKAIGLRKHTHVNDLLPSLEVIKAPIKGRQFTFHAHGFFS